MMKTKSSIISKIKEDWGESSQSSICIKILEYLLKNKANNLTHITYGSLLRVVGKGFVQSEVLTVIQYLCGDRVNLLEVNFELIDENDESYEIPKGELNTAKATGKLVHPETGEEIFDFEKHVYMYFYPSLLINELK